MKRILLFVIGFLCVSIGAWSQTTEVTATTPLSGTNVSSDVTVLHVTGTLTTDDVNFIGSLQSLHLLDLSDVELDASITSLYDVLAGKNYVNGVRVSQTVILPTVENRVVWNDPEMQKWQQQWNGYAQSIAYYTDDTKTNLCYWSGTWQMTYAYNDMSNILPLINDGLTLSFMEMSWQQHYPEVNTASFISAVGQIPARDINFSNINISALGKNFSTLNDNTHFIFLPINNNSAEYDFTIESTDGWTYNDNIWVVGSTFTPGGRQSYFLEGVAVDPVSETTSITYVRSVGAGHLKDAAPYLNDEQKDARRFILCGYVNNYDLDALSAIESYYVDMSTANIVEGTSISNFKNQSVTYLTLPGNVPVDDFVPSTIKANCPKLLGLGMHKDSTTPIENKLYYASWQVGGVRTIMEMLPYAQSTSLTSETTNGIHAYKMWGPLNAADISNMSAVLTPDGHVGQQVTPKTNSSGDIERDNDGNIIFETVTLSGATANGANYGLIGSIQIYDADLSMAWFPTQDDMNFSAASAYGTTTFTNCELPRTNMTTIPANAFNNMQGLHYIAIPNIYTTIKGYAFYLTGSKTVGDGSLAGPLQIDTYQVEKENVNPYSKSAVDDDALIVETISNGPLTVTLPESLGNGDGEGLYTGSMQFTPRVKDVYVMADPAPICQIDAFGSIAYVGNNTYGGVQSHPFARDKYRMGVGTYTEETENQWICVLHFPASTVKNGENKNYTDPTREYCLYDETGEVDGNGMPVVWPNQSEMLRSYNQAITGVTWNAWNRTRIEDPGYGNYNEFATEAGYGVYNTSTPQYNSDATLTDATLTYNKTNYCGWHQFILANTWLPEIVTYEDEEINYVKLDWFTFCIPYNMTKKQVIELLGVPKSDEHVTRKLYGDVQNEDVLPDVRTLVAVTRYPFKSTREIKLHLSKNIVEQPNDLHVELRYDQTKYDLARPQANSDVLGDDNEWVPLTGDENQVYIKGGYPYLIRAYVPEEFADKVSNLGGLTLMRGTFGSQNAGFKHTCTDGYASVAPFEQKVQAYINEEDKDGEENPRVYPALYDDTEDETTSIDATPADGKERYIYTFVGQYWPQYLPLYSYYLGTNSKAAANAETKKKFYRATAKLEGSDVFSKWTWNPYVSIITANADAKVVHEPHKNSSTGAYTSSLSMDFNGYDDTFDKGKAYNGTGDENGAKYVFVFDDGIDEDLNGETTSIGYFNGTPVLPANGKIYNMNGQFVGTSAGSLQKGLYVVNGKKFIIK